MQKNRETIVVILERSLLYSILYVIECKSIFFLVDFPIYASNFCHIYLLMRNGLFLKKKRVVAIWIFSLLVGRIEKIIFLFIFAVSLGKLEKFNGKKQI